MVLKFPGSLVKSILNMIINRIARYDPLKVLCPALKSTLVLMQGPFLSTGDEKITTKAELFIFDTERLEILEATSGVEILNIIVNDDNRIKTIEASLSSEAGIIRAFETMTKQGLEKPFLYNDGLVCQINF